MDDYDYKWREHVSDEMVTDNINHYVETVNQALYVINHAHEHPNSERWLLMAWGVLNCNVEYLDVWADELIRRERNK